MRHDLSMQINPQHVPLNFVEADILEIFNPIFEIIILDVYSTHAIVLLGMAHTLDKG